MAAVTTTALAVRMTAGAAPDGVQAKQAGARRVPPPGSIRPSVVSPFLSVGTGGDDGCCACRNVVFDDLSALHHEFDSLKFGDVGQRIAGNGDDIGEFAFLDGSHTILPTEHFGIRHGPGLDGLCRRHAGTLDEPLEFVSLYSVGERIAIDSTADQDFEAFGGNRHRNSFLKNWNDPVLAAGISGVVVVHGGNGVADESR